MNETKDPRVIGQIVARQREYYFSGATRSLDFRREALRKLYDAVRKNETRIAKAMQADLHKHPLETYMCETGIVLDEIRFHLRHLKRWMKERSVPTPLAQFPSRSFISPEPYGVALIMTPWNYPIQLCLDPLIGAISGGNCAVVKPSAYAPATSRVIAEILSETFPPEYIAVVEGGRQENTALLEQEFDYIFFTGSVEVGKTVMRAAAKHLTPVTLELGGKSPVIIDPSANLKVAARRIAFGKVLNAGQTCVEPDYLLIERSLQEPFLKAYREALDALFPGGDYSDMVHIISEKHYHRKKELLEGQTAAIGGGYDDETRFIEPTVLVDVDPDSPIMQEEIFAPILPVIPWDTLEEAIDFVRARPKPLALYLFTENPLSVQKVLDNCSFGGGCINDTIIHLATSHMGFGGVGQSGMGQYHGKKSFDTFTHYRSILQKSTKIDLPMRYFPYTEKKEKMIKMFLK